MKSTSRSLSRIAFAGVVDCVGGWRARVARGWLTSLVTTKFSPLGSLTPWDSYHPERSR